MAVACAATGGSQGAPEPAGLTPAQLAAKLRSEAARLGEGHASASFAALGARDTKRSVKLTEEQAEQLGLVDQAARDVFRSWLLRGLDRDPLPTAADLAGRLSDRGAKVRRIVNAHAEAIAREAILTPGQARHWRPERGMATGPLEGRYANLMPANAEPRTTPFDIYFMVRSKAAQLDDVKVPASALFRLVSARDTNPLGLSADQIRMVQKLDGLARAVGRGWLLRGLVDPAKQEYDDLLAQDLLDRISVRGRRVLASIVAHAEVIALEAVLDCEQAEGAKRSLWRELGIASLLDAEVAGRLKLSTEQRTEVLGRMVNRARVTLETSSIRGLINVDYVNARLSGRPKARAEQEARGAVAELTSRVAEADAVVLDALTPTQVRALTLLIRQPAPRPAPTKSEKSTPPG